MVANFIFNRHHYFLLPYVLKNYDQKGTLRGMRGGGGCHPLPKQTCQFCHHLSATPSLMRERAACEHREFVFACENPINNDAIWDPQGL